MLSRGESLSAAAVVLSAIAVACYHAPPDPPKFQPVPAPSCGGAPAAALTAARLRRLTDAELQRVVSSLVTDLSLAGLLPRDPLVDGFDDSASSLIVSGPKLDGYVDVANAVAPKLAAANPCAEGQAPEECTLQFGKKLALRLYGRPLTDEEGARLVELEALGRLTEGPLQGLSLVAKAVLLSPYALYRSELGAADAAGDIVALTPYELASAISFLTVGDRPSDDLLAAAERGDLASPDQRVAIARTLLESDAGRAQVRHFVRGWLGMARFDEVRKDAHAFPLYDAALQSSMAREFDRFVDAMLYESNGTLADLLAAPRAYPDEFLGAIYADDLRGPVDPVGGTETDPARRAGILSLPALLAMHATRDGTNPVDRGLLVRTRFLCEELGSPPIAAQMLTIDIGDATRTTRQKFTEHSKDPQCAACHTQMDPIGFGFEGFDGIGKHRDKENGFDVDPHGELVGSDVPGPFIGPAELGGKLASSEQVRRCFAAQAFRFADGRREEAPCDLIDLATGLDGGRAVDVFLRYVARDQFTKRRRLQ